MNSPVNWIGGKHFVAPQIVARFPAHTCYAEPFAGGAHVFFAKSPSPGEILNDLDEDLLNFYEVVQRRAADLARVTSCMPHSRALYAQLLKHPWTPTPHNRLRRAAWFWYLQKYSFAGRVADKSFGYSIHKTERVIPENAARDLLAAGKRLEKVTLEHLPFADLIARYDSPTTLFYCDPPYYRINLYHYNFTDAQHRELSDCLHVAEGMFILSYNDCPEIRALYQWAEIGALEVPYTGKRCAGKRVMELLITKPGQRPGGTGRLF